MRRHAVLLALAVSLLPSAGRAQVHVDIELGLPVAPPLVAVQPGVQVVEGYPEEVFFSGGWYWCRRPDGWYRARSPRARFGWVEPRRVPASLVRIPAGRYRNWHRAEARERRGHEAEHDRRRGGEHERGHEEGRGEGHEGRHHE